MRFGRCACPDHACDTMASFSVWPKVGLEPYRLCGVCYRAGHGYQLEDLTRLGELADDWDGEDTIIIDAQGETHDTT